MPIQAKAHADVVGLGGRSSVGRRLAAAGDTQLAGTKYLWLTTPEHLSAARWTAFGPLRRSALQTARAWACLDRGRLENWWRRRPPYRACKLLLICLLRPPSQ